MHQQRMFMLGIFYRILLHRISGKLRFLTRRAIITILRYTKEYIFHRYDKKKIKNWNVNDYSKIIIMTIIDLLFVILFDNLREKRFEFPSEKSDIA